MKRTCCCVVPFGIIIQSNSVQFSSARLCIYIITQQPNGQLCPSAGVKTYAFDSSHTNCTANTYEIKVCATLDSASSRVPFPSPSLPVFPEPGFRRIKWHMFSGVGIATSIGQPHVVASVCQDEPCRTEHVLIDRPVLCSYDVTWFVCVCFLTTLTTSAVASVTNEWAWSNGGMIATGDTSIRRETSPNVTLSTTTLTCTVPGWNANLRGERSATDHQFHSAYTFPENFKPHNCICFATSSVKLNIEGNKSKHFQHVQGKSTCWLALQCPDVR